MPPANCCYPKDITSEWLTEVLTYSGYDCRVADFSMANIGTGQVGQNIRFDLTYSQGEGPASIVGKFASDDPVSRATGVAVNDYLKEVLFYQHLQKTVDITTPKIHFAAINLEQADEFVIMMEDLAPAVQGDQLGGCSADAANLVLNELAGLTGPRWCDPSLKKIAWLSPQESEADAAKTKPDVLWDMVYPGFVERYESKMSVEHLELTEQLGARFKSYSTPVNDLFTLTHGDYRLDNMMFGGPYPVAVVDWSSSLGSGAADAAYFMGTGMEGEARLKDEKHILMEYHDRMMSYGIENYDFNACWFDYRRSSFAGLVMAVIASMIVGQTERGDEMFMVMARRSADMALHLEALDLLQLNPSS